MLYRRGEIIRADQPFVPPPRMRDRNAVRKYCLQRPYPPMPGLTQLGNTCDSILIPPINTGPRVIVWEVLPGVSVRAVILANRSPGALAKVRSPTLPMFPARTPAPNFFRNHISAPRKLGRILGRECTRCRRPNSACMMPPPSSLFWA
jgi:hypothetical protein